jgi:hypothetical protein
VGLLNTGKYGQHRWIVGDCRGCFIILVLTPRLTCRLSMVIAPMDLNADRMNASATLASVSYAVFQPAFPDWR